MLVVRSCSSSCPSRVSGAWTRHMTVSAHPACLPLVPKHTHTHTQRHSIFPPEPHMNGSQQQMCHGCKQIIDDDFRLYVAPDLNWHVACLLCSECHTPLTERDTCIIRDGRPYCRTDYIRWALSECTDMDLQFCIILCAVCMWTLACLFMHRDYCTGRQCSHSDAH